MYLTTEKKKEIFKLHGKSESDTGSSEGQDSFIYLQDQPFDGAFEN